MPWLEKATDRRASCRGCKKRFEPGDYRIKVTRSGYMRSVYHRYHITCYSKESSVRPPQCLRGLIGFDTFKELDLEIQQQLMSMYPGIVPHKDRACLSLPKSIDQMTVKQLKTELIKRDLPRKGKKQDLAGTLMEYEDNSTLRTVRSKHLAIGYCRKMEDKKHKMNIPIYLKQIVVDYFGVGIEPKYCKEDQPWWKHSSWP